MHTAIPSGGPLGGDRARASFQHQDMKEYLDPPDVINFKEHLYEYLQQEPCYRSLPPDASADQQRRATYHRSIAWIKADHTSLLDNVMDPRKAQASVLCLGEFDWSVVARSGLLVRFIQSGILGLGTERHGHLVEQLEKLEIVGAFCLTEIGHGSNTRAMRTEARYNPDTQTFVIHTPDWQAAKCWAGNLGETCTLGLVFAQLYTPDNECHGLHCFVVPLRDPTTLTTFPGVTLANMGHKLGLNGLDNGVAVFDHYHVPRENLLNKTGDVSPEGHYVSPFKDPAKRFGASLGNLSAGRVSIIGFGCVNMNKALAIAIRYSAVRKQFGPPGGDELPVLDYPLQQWRLFPHLASCYMLNHFSKTFMDHFAAFQQRVLGGDAGEETANLGSEIHALSCCGKSMSGWLARDCIQECREACGGHGYLTAAGFGQLRNDNDANCTYEGDNNVLLAQTSAWLLGMWGRVCQHTPLPNTAMNTMTYLTGDAQLWRYSHAKTDQEVAQYCLSALEAVVRHLCEVTKDDTAALRLQGLDTFTLRNSVQVYREHTLASAHANVVLLRWFGASIQTSPGSVRPVLTRLWALGAVMRLLPLLHYLPTHYFADSSSGEVADTSAVAACLQRHVLRMCKDLRPDAVALVDAVAPPDFCLNSVLGRADGQVYDHLEEAMLGPKGATDRPAYWREMTYPAKL